MKKYVGFVKILFILYFLKNKVRLCIQNPIRLSEISKALRQDPFEFHKDLDYMLAVDAKKIF